jgi:hypothetical protein
MIFTNSTVIIPNCYQPKPMGVESRLRVGTYKAEKANRPKKTITHTEKDTIGFIRVK